MWYSNSVKLIAFVGTQSSGKNTAAAALIDHGFRPFSFADALKDSLAVMFCWPRDMLEGITEESRLWREQVDPWWAERLGLPEFSPRFAMRHFGSLMRTHLNESMWVYNVERRLGLLAPEDAVIIDIRYPNEIALVRRLGGHVERIKRGDDRWWHDAARDVFNEANAQKRQMMIAALQTLIHDSEWAWLECGVDGITTNDGTILDLRTKIVRKFV